MIQKLEKFWFIPMQPERLAILRIVTGFFSFWYLWARYNMFHDVAQTEIDLYDPVGVAIIFGKPISYTAFQVLYWVTVGLNILYILGWKFKYTGPLFGLALLFIMCYRNSWSMIYHNYNGLVLHVLVIGFTASANAISVDRWREKGKNWLEKGSVHWQYGWPIMLICAATVSTYLLAALAKLYGDLAIEWMSGNAMRSQIAVDAIRKELLGSHAPPLFNILYPLTGLFLVTGVMSMILELGAPIALINRKLGMIWSVLTCGMHWGIYFIMGIHFPYHMGGFIFLAFFPLEELWFWITQKI